MHLSDDAWMCVIEYCDVYTAHGLICVCKSSERALRSLKHESNLKITREWLFQICGDVDKHLEPLYYDEHPVVPWACYICLGLYPPPHTTPRLFAIELNNA